MTAARIALTLALLTTSAFAGPQSQTDAGRIADQAIKQRFGTSADFDLPKTSASTPRSGELTTAPVTSAPPTESVPQLSSAEREQLALGASSRATTSARPQRTGSLFDHWFVRTAGALALVVGLMLLCKKFFLKLSMSGGGVASQLGAGGRAPSGVLEVLARYPVSRGHTLVLLKMDRRILLLGHSSSGFTTLSEINDADEVASLLLKTRDEEGETMTARFNALLRGMERDPATIDEPRRSSLLSRNREETTDPVPEITTRRAGLSVAAADLAQRLETIRNRGKGISA